MELNKNFFNINTAKTIALSLGASTLIIGTPLAIGIGIVNNYASKIDDTSAKNKLTNNSKIEQNEKNAVQKKVSLANKMKFVLDYLNDFRFEDESISKKMLFLNNKNEQFIYDAFFSSIHGNFGTYEDNFKTLDEFTKFLNNNFIQKVDSKEFLKSPENKNKIFNQKILDKFIDSIKVDPFFKVTEFKTILDVSNNWEDLQQRLNDSLKSDFIISADDLANVKVTKTAKKKEMLKLLFQRKLIDSLLPKHFSNFNLDGKDLFIALSDALFDKLFDEYVDADTLAIKDSIDDTKKEAAKTSLETSIDTLNIKNAFDQLTSKFNFVNGDQFNKNIKKIVKNMYYKVNVMDIKEILKSKWTNEKTDDQIKTLLGDLFLKNGLTKNIDVSVGSNNSDKSFSAFVIKNLFGITKKEFDGFNFKTYQNKIDSSFDDVDGLTDKTNIFVWEGNDFASSEEEAKEKIKNLEILTFDSFKEFFVQDETLKKEYSKQTFNDLFLKTFTTESNSSFFNLNLKNISDLIYDSLYNNYLLGISVFEDNDNKLETIFDNYAKGIETTVLPKILEIIDQKKIDLLTNEINKAILKFGLSEPIVDGSITKIKEKILEVIKTDQVIKTDDVEKTDETPKTYNLKEDFIKITNLLEDADVTDLDSDNPLIVAIATFFTNKFNNPDVSEANLINFLTIENENNGFFKKDDTGLNSVFFSKLLAKFNTIDVTDDDAQTKEKNFIDAAITIFNESPETSRFSKIEGFAKKVYDFFKNDYKEIFIDNFINDQLLVVDETFSFFSQDAFDVLVRATTFNEEQKTKLINGVSILDIIKVFHTSKADVAKIAESNQNSEPEVVTPAVTTTGEDVAETETNQDSEPEVVTPVVTTTGEDVVANQDSAASEEIADTETNQDSAPVVVVSEDTTTDEAVSNNEDGQNEDSNTPLVQESKTTTDVSNLDIQAKKDEIKNIIVKIISTSVDKDGAEIEDELNTKINDLVAALYNKIDNQNIPFLKNTAKFYDQIIKTLDQDFFDEVDKIMNVEEGLFVRFNKQQKILSLVLKKINWDQKITKVNSEFLSSLVQTIFNNYNGATKIKVSSLPKEVYKIFNVQTKTTETLKKELKEALLEAVSGDVEEFNTVAKFSTWFFTTSSLNKFNFKKDSSIFNAFDDDAKNEFNKLFHVSDTDAMLSANLFTENKKSPFSISHNKWDKKNWNVEDIWSTFEESENKKAIDQENSNELDLLLNDLIIQYLNELEFYQITNVLDKLISNYFVEEKDLVNSGLGNDLINDLKNQNILVGNDKKLEDKVLKNVNDVETLNEFKLRSDDFIHNQLILNNVSTILKLEPTVYQMINNVLTKVTQIDLITGEEVFILKHPDFDDVEAPGRVIKHAIRDGYKISLSGKLIIKSNEKKGFVFSNAKIYLSYNSDQPDSNLYTGTFDNLDLSTSYTLVPSFGDPVSFFGEKIKEQEGYIIKRSKFVLNGEKGDTGEKGDQGDQGPQGLQGDTGATGSQGEKGDRGDYGPSGSTGPQGLQGATFIGATIYQNYNHERLDDGKYVGNVNGLDDTHRYTIVSSVGPYNIFPGSYIKKLNLDIVNSIIVYKSGVTFPGATIYQNYDEAIPNTGKYLGNVDSLVDGNLYIIRDVDGNYVERYGSHLKILNFDIDNDSRIVFKKHLVLEPGAIHGYLVGITSIVTYGDLAIIPISVSNDPNTGAIKYTINSQTPIDFAELKAEAVKQGITLTNGEDAEETILNTDLTGLVVSQLSEAIWKKRSFQTYGDLRNIAISPFYDTNVGAIKYTVNSQTPINFATLKAQAEIQGITLANSQDTEDTLSNTDLTGLNIDELQAARTSKTNAQPTSS